MSLSRDVLVQMMQGQTRESFKALLESYFRTPAGLADLAAAPRVQRGDGSHPMTAVDAVESLLEEYRSG